MAKNKRLSATGAKSRKPQPRNSPKNKKRASTARVPDTAAAAAAPAVALADEATTDLDSSVADQDTSAIDDDDALPTVKLVEDANGKDEPERHAEQEQDNEVPAVAPAADEPLPQVVEPVLQVVEPVVVKPIVEEPIVEEPVVEEPVSEPAPAAPAASAHLEPEPAPERRRTASSASRTPDATFGGATGAPSMIRIYLPSSVASNRLQSSMEFMLAPSTDGKTPSFTLRRVPKVTVTPKMPFVLVEQHHAEKLLTMRKELLIKDHAEPKAAMSAATAASAAPRARTISAHSRVSGTEERSESVWMLEFASDSEDNGHVHYVDEQGVEHDACLVGDDKIEELPSEPAPTTETVAREAVPTPATVAPVTEPVEAPLDAAPQEPAPQEPAPQQSTPGADATPSPSDSAAPSVTDPPAAAAPAPPAVAESTPAAAPAEPAKAEPQAEPVARALSPTDLDDDAGTDSAVVTESAATSASLPRAAALPYKDSKDKLMVRLKRSFLSLRRKSSSASLASSSTLTQRASDSSSSADEADEKKVSESRGSATLARGTGATLPRASGDKEGKPSLLKKLRHRVSKLGSDSDDEEHEAKKAAKKAAKAEKKAQKLLKKQEKEAAKTAAGARKSRFGSSA
ncbi:hypothetical protein GGF31_003751 [Allomyces arbusculus]|nr:hypothetical protein GGF31_003751 [Allomyces arbusculus]